MECFSLKAVTPTAPDREIFNQGGLHLEGTMNTTNEAILDHIRTNIRRPLPQCKPHPVQKDTVAILAAGGPSLTNHVEEIRGKRDAGAKLFCVNGTGRFMLQNGIKPSVQVILDARPQNINFIGTPDPKIRYLIASQCHPMVFDYLKGHDVWIWHAAGLDDEAAILNRYYHGQWNHITGGSTVTLRTIWLMRTLGFKQIHIYGMDSCYLYGGEHHAYKQDPEDHQKCKVTVGSKEFVCDLWMYSQAVDFANLSAALGHELELAVHGDGLIASFIKAVALGEGVKKPEELLSKEMIDE